MGHGTDAGAGASQGCRCQDNCALVGRRGEMSEVGPTQCGEAVAALGSIARPVVAEGYSSAAGPAGARAMPVR